MLDVFGWLGQRSVELHFMLPKLSCLLEKSLSMCLVGMELTLCFQHGLFEGANKTLEYDWFKQIRGIKS